MRYIIAFALLAALAATAAENGQLLFRSIDPSQTSRSISGGGQAALVIKSNGDVTWKGRSVESDEQFRTAVIDLVRILRRDCR